MSTPDQIKAILNQIAAGQQTQADIIALRDAVMISGDQIVVQQGNNSINIGHIGQAGDIQINPTYYRADAETIKVVLREILSEFQAPRQPSGIPQNLPRSGVSKFVGREETLAILHQQLQQKERVAISAIAGMGGVGKTELALQYARYHWQQQTYPGGVCWLQARALDVGIQIVGFARAHLQLNPPEDLDLSLQVAFCWRHWLPGEVLLVLDDVTDYKRVKDYLPPEASRFKVLITSRLQLGSSIQQLLLNVLKPRVAVALLMSLVGRDRLQQEAWVARKLCRWLGYLPLGLELVGRYLKRKPDLSLTEMLSRLEAKRLEQLALRKPKSEADMTAQWGVQDAFELSWQELDESAKQLGLSLSLFALAPIPWSLVEQSLPEIDSEELEETRDYGLITLHLVERKGQTTYQLHQLIREFFKAKLEKSTLADDLKRGFCQAMVAIAKKIPDSPTLEQINAFKEAIPHLEEVAQTQTAAVLDEDLVWPFIGVGRFYEGQGLYAQAEPWHQQCLSVVQERLGENHPDVALSLNNLASLYNAQGRYTEAEPLYQQALNLFKRLLGEEHPDVALSLNNLAHLYSAQGRYAEAEPLYCQALDLFKRLLEEEHPDVALSLNNLAHLYSAQGRYTEAESFYLQALAMRIHLMGEHHPSVATSLNNLAHLYSAQGRYAEAEPLLQQALDLNIRLLGEEHPLVATSLNNLALLYNDQGRYAEAEPLYLQALDLSIRLLGEEHPHVAQSLNNLAVLYNDQGRYAEAEPLLQQALDLSIHLLGENHPHVITRLSNLAYLYKAQGRYTKAEPLYQQALDLSIRLLGENHPHVAQSLYNLAYLYKTQGRYAEAEPLYLQALALRKRLLGEKHPDVATSLNNLATLYQAQERYAKAEPLYLQALDLRKCLLGKYHPDIAQSLNNLASLYEYQERYAEAEPLYLQALDLFKRLQGEHHPDVFTSLNNLAGLYRTQGRYAEAEPLYQQALNLSIRLLGENHPLVAISLNNLAYLYKSQGRYIEAEPLYVQALEIADRVLGANHPTTITIRENLQALRSNRT